MHCQYCVLQAYFEDQSQVVFDNREDLAAEVAAVMSRYDDSAVVRIGTGEFADSLYLEERFGLACLVAGLFDQYPNTLVEFKTKWAQVKSLKAITNPHKIVIGFSMNTPVMIERFERGTSSIPQRLAAAAQCEAMGFAVAFHFDPMFRYPGWEEQYRQVARMICDTIKDHRRIAWWSMGGFRSVTGLKKKLAREAGHLPLFNGEMVVGNDHKLRYFRPLRAQMYRAVLDECKKIGADVPLYLCMESPEVWEESGMLDRIPGGMVQYLDDRARAILHRE